MVFTIFYMGLSGENFPFQDFPWFLHVFTMKVMGLSGENVPQQTHPVNQPTSHIGSSRTRWTRPFSSAPASACPAALLGMIRYGCVMSGTPFNSYRTPISMGEYGMVNDG